MTARHRELTALASIAAHAGRVIVEAARHGFHVTHKASGDPVTDLDERANELVLRELARAFPGDAVVSEEGGGASVSDARRCPRIFFVDPLDGTRELVEGRDEYAVMIGLVEGDLAKLGVVHCPATGVTWCGAREGGAYRTTPAGERSEVRVGCTTRLVDARIVASRSHRSEQLERQLRRFGARELRAMGSAGLKGARVAEGSADAFVAVGSAGKLWDICAIDALIAAAGGRLTDAGGRAPDYRHADMSVSNGIVAANATLHRELLRVLSDAGAGDLALQSTE